MPVALFLAVQIVNPGYLDPMLEGWGLLWLGATLLSMGVGMWLILRLVNEVDV
jgi:Flp pilus assembly protein TadB